MRLIDADAAATRITENLELVMGEDQFGAETITALVRNALKSERITPTIDPVTRGTWDRKSCVNGKQYDPTTDYWAYAHRCSECDKVSYFPNDIPDKWCRHCGAKMDGDGDAR